MFKIIKKIWVGIMATICLPTVAYALAVYQPVQGGTGISSATSTGKCLKVSATNPFTYILDTCGGSGTVSGSSTAGNVTFWRSATTIAGSNQFVFDSSTGHVGLGIAAQAATPLYVSSTISSTLPIGVRVENTLANSTVNQTVLGSFFRGQSKATGSNLISQIGGAQVIGGHRGSGSVTDVFGFIGDGINYGSGHVSNAYGGLNRVFVNGSGNVDNAFGEFVTSPFLNSTGKVKNAYGVFVNPQIVGTSTNFAFYYASTSPTVINGAGFLGINSTTPRYALDVKGVGEFAKSSAFGRSNILVNNFDTKADPLGVGFGYKTLGVETLYSTSTTSTSLGVAAVSSVAEHDMTANSAMILSGVAGSAFVRNSSGSSKKFTGIATGNGYSSLVDGVNVGLDASSTSVFGAGYPHLRGFSSSVIARRGSTLNYGVGVDSNLNLQNFGGYNTSTVGKFDLFHAYDLLNSNTHVDTLIGFHSDNFKRSFIGTSSGTVNVAYGVKVENPTIGTVNWGIGTAGNNYFASSTTFGSSSIPRATVDVENGAIIATGTTGNTPGSGAGTRFMWIPAKAAIRAGHSNGNEWDDANIGQYSAAFGLSSEASALGSFAANAALATGQYSAAFGGSSVASGNYSAAFGQNNVVSQVEGAAFGVNNQVLDNGGFGAQSVAFGSGNIIKSQDAFSSGFNNTITGNQGFTAGSNNTASNTAAFAVGSSNVAGGNSSIALGSNNVASSLYSVAVGAFNTARGNYTQAYGTDMTVNGTSSIGFNFGFNPTTLNATNTLGIFNGAIFASGTIGNTPTSGVGTRLMWIPSKGAFRAGHVGGSHWDNANIGLYSVAFGESTEASGVGSFVVGQLASASGTLSVAMGNQANAGGDSSLALGPFTSTQNLYDTALGNHITAGPNQGIMVLGQNGQAQGSNSMLLTINSSTTAPIVMTQPNSFALMGGNVGVGTVAPFWPLSIYSTSTVIASSLPIEANVFSHYIIKPISDSALSYTGNAFSVVIPPSSAANFSGNIAGAYSRLELSGTGKLNSSAAAIGMIGEIKLDTMSASTSIGIRNSWDESLASGAFATTIGMQAQGTTNNKVQQAISLKVNPPTNATLSNLALYTTGGKSIINDQLDIASSTFSTGNTLQVGGYALFKQSFGSMAESTDGTGSGSSITLTTAGVYYGWKGASSSITYTAGAGYVTSSIAGGATSTLVIGQYGAGTYQISYSSSLQSNANNDVIHCVVFKNGVQQKATKGEMLFNGGGANQTHAVDGGPAYIKLVPTDRLDLRCADDSAGGTTLTFQHVNFGIDRIGSN